LASRSSVYFLLLLFALAVNLPRDPIIESMAVRKVSKQESGNKFESSRLAEELQVVFFETLLSLLKSQLSVFLQEDLKG